MDKRFADYFTSCGLTVEGEGAYGVLRGYECNFLYDVRNQAAPVQLWIAFKATEQQQEDLLIAFNQHKLKWVKMYFNDLGVLVAINDMTAKSLYANLPDKLNVIFDVLESQKIPNANTCPKCGAEFKEGDEKKTANLDGVKITMHAACVDQINNEILQAKEARAAAPNNYLKGALGALIGGVVGAGVAFLLFNIGFVAAISAFVSIYLGEFLYRKFGGKENYGMIVILAVVTLVFMAVPVTVTYAMAIAPVAAEFGIPFMEAVSICAQDPEFVSAFTYDTIMMLAFTGIGIIYEVIRLVRKVKMLNR